MRDRTESSAVRNYLRKGKFMNTAETSKGQPSAHHIARRQMATADENSVIEPRALAKWSELVWRVWSRIFRSQPPDRAPDTPSVDDTFGQSLTHLTYLGYEIRPGSNGWMLAQHPYRYDFHLRAFPGAVSLICQVDIGTPAEQSRAEWLDHLNTANHRSHMTRFSLDETKAGRLQVRMCAIVTGTYSRPTFAMAMDGWQGDLEFARKPAVVKPDNARDHLASHKGTVH